MAQSAETRHDHLWKSGAGTLSVDDSGIGWTEPGEPKHSRTWRWQDIQQLRLSQQEIRLLTYEDAKWRGNRDREYTFRPVPEKFAGETVRVLRKGLGAKLASALPEEIEAPVWQLPVKLQERLGGSEGRLTFGGGRLVYESPERGKSRTWEIAEIESVSSAGRFELTVTPYERAGWTRGLRDFRFQLKEPISETQYQKLWMAVQGSHGLAFSATRNPIHSSSKEQTHP